MPLTTKITCDLCDAACGDLMRQVYYGRNKHLYFCGIECLAKWSADELVAKQERDRAAMEQIDARNRPKEMTADEFNLYALNHGMPIRVFDIPQRQKPEGDS